jgi:hypothetical protein
MFTGPSVEIRETGMAASHEGAHAALLGECQGLSVVAFGPIHIGSIHTQRLGKGTEVPGLFTPLLPRTRPLETATGSLGGVARAPGEQIRAAQKAEPQGPIGAVVSLASENGVLEKGDGFRRAPRQRVGV